MAALGWGWGRFCPHSWERNVGHLPLSDLSTGASAVGWCPLLSASLKEDRRRVSDPPTRSPTWARSSPERPTWLLEKRAEGGAQRTLPWPLPGERENRNCPAPGWHLGEAPVEGSGHIQEQEQEAGPCLWEAQFGCLRTAGSAHGRSQVEPPPPPLMLTALVAGGCRFRRTFWR